MSRRKSAAGGGKMKLVKGFLIGFIGGVLVFAGTAIVFEAARAANLPGGAIASGATWGFWKRDVRVGAAAVIGALAGHTISAFLFS